MNSLLIKHFIYIIILLSTSIVYSSNDTNQCKNSFSNNSILNHLNDHLKDVMNTNGYIKNKEKLQGRTSVEQEILNIINNSQFIDIINSQNKDNKKGILGAIKAIIFTNNPWDFIEGIVRGITLEKHINTFFTYADTEYRKLIINTLKSQQPQKGNKKLQLAFLRLYSSKDPLFREWFYKLQLLNNLKLKIKEPIEVLTQLEKSLQEEIENSDKRGDNLFIRRQIYNTFNMEFSKDDNTDFLDWTYLIHSFMINFYTKYMEKSNKE